MEHEPRTLLSDLAGGVLTLTINRPDRGNALDGQTVQALIEAFEDVAVEQGGARAVLLRSEGRHFCTGADLGGAGDRAESGTRPAIGHMIRSLDNGVHRLVRTLWDCRLPVVAELTGRTSGLGLHVALACDLTVAAQSATFAEPFSDRGFNVDSGGSWLLPRFVGLTRAKRLLYSAEAVDAPTAAEWGLVSEVVADDQVEPRASALASELARRPTLALGAMKQLLHRGLTLPLTEALQNEAAAIELSIRSSDFKEGMLAFVEKRDPDFTGR